MSYSTELLATIKKNYDDASDNEASDLADAKSAADVAAIQANVAVARSTYYKAVVTLLSNSGHDVDVAYQNAINPQNSIADARKKSAGFEELLGKLSSATDKAATLLNKARFI